VRRGQTDVGWVGRQETDNRAARAPDATLERAELGAMVGMLLCAGPAVFAGECVGGLGGQRVAGRVARALCATTGVRESGTGESAEADYMPEVWASQAAPSR
jgi:hypothetical protein